MKLVIGAGIAFLLHWMLGWAWSALAGVAMGVWVGRRGWLLGGLAVGLSWAILIVYTFIANPEATARMTDILGSIFGGLPGLAVPATSLLMGILLGVSGGLFGTGLRSVWKLIGK